MTTREVDDYLAAVPEPQRSTLVSMRATIAGLLPDAEQGIAYGIPCFTIDGSHVAGIGCAKGHCTYFPMSGSITAELADELTETVRGERGHGSSGGVAGWTSVGPDLSHSSQESS